VSILKYFRYWAAEFISDVIAAAKACKALAVPGWCWQVIGQEVMLA